MWLDDVSVAELKVAGEEEMTEGGNLLPRASNVALPNWDVSSSSVNDWTRQG